MNLVCEYLGGSHSYGLNTPDSDEDTRGIFKFDSIRKVINPHDSDTTSKVRTPEEHGNDAVHVEFRHFLNLLKKGNTQSMEMVFNKNWILITPLFEEVIAKRKSLIEMSKFRSAIEGYAMSEYQLALGFRTGKLGGKRHTAITKYGFSPKNFVNLFRLLYSAEVLFETGELPVNLTGSYIHPQLMELKLYPERFSVPRLNEMFNEKINNLFKVWDKQKVWICGQYKYNADVATKLIIKCYEDQILTTANLGFWRYLNYRCRKLFSSSNGAVS